MSLGQPSIETIELTIQEAQKKVDRAEALRKLHGNREFKKLILEDYFDTELKRLGRCLGSSSPSLVASRDEAVIEIQAIAKLQEFFATIIREGRAMEQLIAEHTEMLAELRAHETDGAEEELA